MPVLTKRDATLPSLKGKAASVIGMRRAGKTSFLHQCRAELIAAGRSPGRLHYFNFEDEHLGDMPDGQLHLIPDTHLRLFPEPADEPVTLFLDEIQLVSGWETLIRRLLDTPGYELFLSDSSAKLLSREIATSMRERAWEIPIHGRSGSHPNPPRMAVDVDGVEIDPPILSPQNEKAPSQRITE